MRHVLIIKPSSFGDIVQALPAAARLRESFPSATISWLVNGSYRRLLEGNPCVDRLFIFERDLFRNRGDLRGAVGSFARLYGELRRSGADAVLDLQGLLRSGLLAAATRAPLRVGFENAREGSRFFYTRRVAVPSPETHAVERYLLAARAAGCADGAVSFPLGGGEAEEAWARAVLDRAPLRGRSPLVGLSTSARWRTKRWPPVSFARLADLLAGEGAGVLMLGGFGGEGEEASRLTRSGAPAVDGVEDPLRMAALLRRLDALVSNDSGLMHLAAAVGTPVVALFGPTNPARTGPWGRGHRVLCSPVACRPCYRKECDREGGCMGEIAIEEVRAAVEAIVRGRAAR